MPLLCKYSYKKNYKKYSNQKQNQIFLSKIEPNIPIKKRTNIPITKTEPNIPIKNRTKYSYQKQNQIFLSQKQNQIFLSKQNQILLPKPEPNVPIKNRTKLERFAVCFLVVEINLTQDKGVISSSLCLTTLNKVDGSVSTEPGMHKLNSTYIQYLQLKGPLKKKRKKKKVLRKIQE